MSPLGFLPAFPCLSLPYLSVSPPPPQAVVCRVRAGISSAVFGGPIRAFRTRWARELSLCVWMWVWVWFLAWQRVQVGL